MLGTNRWLYNKVLYNIENENERDSFQYLRNKYVTKRNNKVIKDNEYWCFETPKEIRAYTLKKLSISYKTNKKVWKEYKEKKKKYPNIKHREPFKMKFKSKKAVQETMKLPHQSANIKNGLKIYPDFIKDEIEVKNYKDYKWLLDNGINHDFEISFVKPNIWYLLIPYNKKRLYLETNRIIALDPGLRKFQTGIDNDGNIIQIASHEYDKIKKRKHIINCLKSKLEIYKKEKKRLSASKTKRWINYQYWKVRNMVDDMHHKTCKFLLDNYDIILLPKFSPPSMVKHENSRKNNNFNEKLLSFCHGRFRELMLVKQRYYKNKIVYIADEAYTSQICSRCKKSTKTDKEIFECFH
jgi:putative transposase